MIEIPLEMYRAEVEIAEVKDNPPSFLKRKLDLGIGSQCPRDNGSHWRKQGILTTAVIPSSAAKPRGSLCSESEDEQRLESRARAAAGKGFGQRETSRYHLV